MQMNASSIVNQKAEWEKLGVKLPAFDHAAMTAATKEHPIWVHFGAGNIFRGFIAALQQRLLNEGLADRGANLKGRQKFNTSLGIVRSKITASGNRAW